MNAKKPGITRLPTREEKLNRIDTPEAERFIKDGALTPPAEPVPRTPSSEAVFETPNDEFTAAYPWIDASPKHLKLVPLRMPEDEAMMLKYLGETTYGNSANSIMLSAVRKEIAKRMRDRGFKVTQDRKGKISVLS
jgi:hypothetical protein